MTLGANEVTFYPLDNYRLSGAKFCFAVSAYMHANELSLGSPRRFCARNVDGGWWSMR